MAKKMSAGILMYRLSNSDLEVFLVHPGGPYWARKDEGSWSIPKGEFEEGDDPFETAKREFYEETGIEISGRFLQLMPVKQPSGKVIYAWAVEGDIDVATVKSNTFTMEWPPRSGIQQEFPEVDKGEWFKISKAYEKILPGQRGFLDQLRNLVDIGVGKPSETKTGSGKDGDTSIPRQGTLF